MSASSSKRRSLTITVLVILLVGVAWYSHSYPDTERFIAILLNVAPTTISTTSSLESHSQTKEEPQLSPSAQPELAPGAAGITESSSSSIHEARTSRLHYLIPASLPNLHFCYNLVSSAVNRFPVPTLLGWHGQNEFDAAITHLAKLRAMERYFDSLPPEEDDDLVIIVDGYDILIQLPPEIMVERYFEVAARADARLASKFGTSIDELHDRGLRQTIFWGPDKLCWPIDPRAPRCWIAPESPIPLPAWGPNKADDIMFYSDPRWLNSGTVMAPIGDMRRYIAATMEEVIATQDPFYEFKESDQYYLSNVWGRQEYWRAKMAANGEVPGGPPDRIIPEKRTPDQQTEFHISIEYESALFQTRAGYQPYFGYMKFNNSDLTANLTADIQGEGYNFPPTAIKMPENVATALTKLYNDIPEAHPGSTAADWLRVVELGVNYITHHIYGIWHCTGPKEFVGLEYPTLWFYPFVKSLLKVSTRASQAKEPLTTKLIDGRRWVPKHYIPSAEIMSDEYGGAWTDQNGGEFVPWKGLCGLHEDVLFKGEESIPNKIQE